jgi:hypothetical protein
MYTSPLEDPWVALGGLCATLRHTVLCFGSDRRGSIREGHDREQAPNPHPTRFYRMEAGNDVISTHQLTNVPNLHVTIVIVASEGDN